MVTLNSVFAAGLLLFALTGCAGQSEAKPESGVSAPETHHAEDPLNSTDAATMPEVDVPRSDANPTGELVKPDDAEKEHPDSTDAAADAEQNAPVLIVYGWDEITVKRDDRVFPLDSQQAEFITELFYNHESEILEGPISLATTVQFKIGEDYLATSHGANGTLDGTVNGELVMLELEQDEWDTVCQIVSHFLEDDFW